MADLVSPGILIKETDLTTVVPPVGGTSAGIVIPAEWGPAEEAITVSSETDLVEVFGKPLTGVTENWLVAASYLSYASNLQVARSLDGSATGTYTDSNASDGAAVTVKNSSHFNSLSFTDHSFIARYPGVKGNELGVGIITNGGTTASVQLSKAGAIVASGGVKTLTYSDFFDYDPTTTEYVAARGGSADEVHVVIFDKKGSITGVIGSILEKFTGLSLANDAKDSFGASNYIKDVLYAKSKWVYFSGDWTSIIADADATNWDGGKDSTTTFDDFEGTGISDGTGGTGYKTVILENGAGATAAAQSAARAAVYSLLWADKETSDISILIGGTDTGAGTGTATPISSELIEIAEARKDCIAFVSPPRNDGSNNLDDPTRTTSQKATQVKTWGGPINSSYVIIDSGWKKTYNRYTDTYMSIPLNGDTAGLTALTEQTNDSWWSPAGYNRGNVRNVYELYFNPDKNARDSLYQAGINPVVSFPGQGVVLFGDKTSLNKPSAFDRINVRRLFIHVEKAISTAAKSMLFEFNDEFTRSQFRNMVEPFLRDVKARRGIYDYKVICDSTNNTSAVIDRNEFVGDIYIKPARSINFIRLNFVAVRTGVEFSEVAG